MIRGPGGLSQFSGQGNLIEVFTISVCLREVLTKRRIILRQISLRMELKELHVSI